MRVRRLGVGDLAGLRALNALFADVFEDAESYARRPPADAWAQALLARPDLLMLVAEADGAVVGGLVGYVLDKFEAERREIYIYDLGVAETHRRQGIATGLIREVQRQAAELGAWTIYVQADPEDAPALALYRGLGTEEAVFHFEIPPRSRD
jgi:aminoglycoside 3-N-acetyltransferase I